MAQMESGGLTRNFPPTVTSQEGSHTADSPPPALKIQPRAYNVSVQGSALETQCLLGDGHVGILCGVGIKILDSQRESRCPHNSCTRTFMCRQLRPSGPSQPFRECFISVELTLSPKFPYASQGPTWKQDFPRMAVPDPLCLLFSVHRASFPCLREELEGQGRG